MDLDQMFWKKLMGNSTTRNKEFHTFLRNIRIKNVNRVIVATLNINSIRNKFDQLKLSIMGNVDILVITETKLDGTFPTAMFMIDGYSKPYRRDRNAYGGGYINIC